jgi:hypothetical protein
MVSAPSDHGGTDRSHASGMVAAEDFPDFDRIGYDIAAHEELK